MPIDYDEKRDFIRMAANHALQYSEVGTQQTHQGTCINLSATGILFTTDQPLALGTELAVNITPQYSVVSPFDAVIKVTRAEVNGADGQFQIAGEIIKINGA